jgi:predicted GH43/DUF377 family glycosyl hydrolase
MTKAFWSLFCNDYRKNCLAWQHSARNPVIPASGSTWKSHWTANPEILEFAGKRLLYYRGNGTMPGPDQELHDRIGVAQIIRLSTDNIEIQDLNDGLPIIDLGDPEAFDRQHILDPAAIVFQGKILLYYTAVGKGQDSIGLASSSDGIKFTKLGKIIEGRAPDVVIKDGRIHMLLQRANGKGGHEFFIASSSNGMSFNIENNSPVLAPTARPAWDGYDVTTGRLFSSDEGFFLLYGGSSSLTDQPDYFGLAKSNDLIHWERHPGNPIFGCGPKGSEDGGAIWYPALIETQDKYILLYEGSRGGFTGDISSSISMASIGKSAITKGNS